jgi:hypothetical protein
MNTNKKNTIFILIILFILFAINALNLLSNHIEFMNKYIEILFPITIILSIICTILLLVELFMCIYNKK